MHEFGTPRGFRELDGRPYHEIAERLAAGDLLIPNPPPYACKTTREAEWKTLFMYWRNVVPDPVPIPHALVSEDALQPGCDAFWVNRNTYEDYTWASNRRGIERTAMYLAAASHDAEALAATWMLACLRDLAGRTGSSEDSQLRIKLPRRDEIELACRELAQPEWHQAMTSVLPIQMHLPQRVALEPTEFAYAASMHYLAVSNTYWVIAAYGEVAACRVNLSRKAAA